MTEKTSNVTTLEGVGPEWEYTLTIRKQADMFFITPVDGMEDKCPLTFGAILDLGDLEEALTGAKKLQDEAEADGD